ncbi:unnamed protein product [Eruca vesicaria subsp. sativa]|uniref:LOB domain-containing protein n=1 Tax=Eruca vesicaria subsp. sativa TaxID=29727 RepID=A0ABC8K8B9_ERUVS|nr:unnamed protein product [Eruca vesicaria subsp. sativa]
MEALGTNTKRRPCCICMWKTKICNKNCEFAAYFPNEMQGDYASANELFGTPNIIRMMKLAPQDQKPMLAFSILKEGVAWTNDKIEGGFGVIKNLMREINRLEADLSYLRKNISEEKEKNN